MTTGKEIVEEIIEKDIIRDNLSDTDKYVMANLIDSCFVEILTVLRPIAEYYKRNSVGVILEYSENFDKITGKISLNSFLTLVEELEAKYGN